MPGSSQHIEIDVLYEGLLAGERVALSRAITLVESRHPAHRVAAARLLEKISAGQDRSIRSLRLGITGSPGAGKSTFIERLGLQFIEDGNKLAVLAIDPSSSLSHGSILGDKTRMEKLSRERNAFIRPSPAGNQLGGTAAATREAVLLCEMAGFDRIIIETVGVGQSEHSVRRLSDLMILLLLPGGGDDLQGIKRGIVELADLLVINKADGQLLQQAQQTERDYKIALQHAQTPGRDLVPEVLSLSALHGNGMDRFGESLQNFLSQLGVTGIQARRAKQNVDWFDELWPRRLMDLLRTDEDLEQKVEQLRLGIQRGEISPDEASQQLLERWIKPHKF